MRDRIPFSHLLPLIDLALLVILVFVPVTLTALRLYQAASGSDHMHLHSSEFDLDLPRDQIVPWAIRVATVPRAESMVAINLPGSLIQSIISLPSHTPASSGWNPRALALETWQALVFPFFALPFWWLVGCGLDALIYKERLHWSLGVIGTLFFTSYLVSFIAIWLGMSASERSGFSMTSFVGWTVGFATLPIAWIVQSIRERRSGEAPGA